MLAQHELPVASSAGSSKLLRLLRMRLRQLVRVTLVLVIGLAVAVTAIGVWWLTSLNGLPDIGEPFDFDAFRAVSVPDNQNAFAYLRRGEKAHPPSGPEVGQCGEPGRSQFLVVERESELA